MQTNKWLAILTLVSGFLISGVSAYFSIFGLSKLFTESLIAGAIVFGVLEMGKLVAASWTYRNWNVAPRLLKSFMTAAVVIMMAITSLGIFGYLAEAYTNKTTPLTSQKIDQTAVDQQIVIQQDRISGLKDTLNRLNRSLDKKQEVDKNGSSLTALRQNRSEINRLNGDITTAQTNLIDLQKKKAGNLTTIAATSTDLGPLSFIAKSIFDDSQASLDKAVRIMISLLVTVFDPLAVALLLAANFSFQQMSESKHNTKILDGPIPVNRQELQTYLGPQTTIEHIPEDVTNFDETEHVDEGTTA